MGEEVKWKGLRDKTKVDRMNDDKMWEGTGS